MAGEGATGDGVFRRSTMNRIASADDLDHYIKVTNPSAWIITCAALLLIAGIIVWAVVAIVPVTVNTTGFLLESQQDDEGVVVCWVNKPTADKIRESGAKASVNGVEAQSVMVDETPVSLSETREFLGSEFYLESLGLSAWNYQVTMVIGEKTNRSDYVIETSLGAAYPVPVSIVVSETRPINIVLGKE